MIIDIHRHPVAKEWFSDNFWKGFARMIQPMLNRKKTGVTIDSVISDFFPFYFDKNGEKHISQMQAAGIDKTVMFLFDIGLFTEEPEVSIREQNKILFNVSKKYPNQIIPFAHIDPRRPGAIEFVKECVEEYGAKGLKIHPGSGFNPSENETLKLIESIADYHIPVITHTGASVPPTSSKFCDPVYLDDILLRFPDVNVIAAHMSYGHRHQLFALGLLRPNLYTDISGWQSVAKHNYPQFVQILREAIDSFGPERVLFGTDGPFLWPTMSDKDYVQVIKDLPNKSPEGITFTVNEVDMILGNNAHKLLGI